MKKKKIFISGVAGFLGSHLADKFIEKGHSVVGTDSLIGGYMDNVSSEVEFYTYDCNFLNSMKKITKDVDVVYHCAATAYEGLSVFSPYHITKNVFQNTASVLTAAVSNNVKRFIFASSMARYGKNEVPFNENMEPNPQDPYGIAKVASELLVRNVSETHGLEHVIAVPHNIIGPRQKYDDPYRNVAAIFINRMLQGKQPIIYGDGNQKRCFSFVDDDIKCLEKMAFQGGLDGQIINIGPDEEFVTVNELAGNIADLLNFKLDPIYVKDRPQEVKLATCSANKARELLDYNTSYTLEKGLKQMIDYIQEKGAKPFRYHIDLEIVNDKTPETWKKKLI
jgi:UDP-glucose 4-epimerase